LKLLDLDWLAQVHGKSSGEAFSDAFLHAVATEGDAGESVPVVQLPHEISTGAIGQGQVTDDQIKFFAPSRAACALGGGHAATLVIIHKESSIIAISLFTIVTQPCGLRTPKPDPG